MTSPWLSVAVGGTPWHPTSRTWSGTLARGSRSGIPACRSGNPRPSGRPRTGSPPRSATRSAFGICPGRGRCPPLSRWNGSHQEPRRAPSDGELLLAASDANLCLHRSTGDTDLRISLPVEWVDVAARFSPGGRYILAETGPPDERYTHIFDTGTGEPVEEIPGRRTASRCRTTTASSRSLVGRSCSGASASGNRSGRSGRRRTRHDRRDAPSGCQQREAGTWPLGDRSPGSRLRARSCRSGTS